MSMIAFIKKLLEFFQEDNGNMSNARLNSTLEQWAGIAILIGGSFKLAGATLDSTTITAAFGLIAAGSGQKLIQKTQEEKSDPAKQEGVQ
jgi:hypothetical protein